MFFRVKLLSITKYMVAVKIFLSVTKLEVRHLLGEFQVVNLPSKIQVINPRARKPNTNNSTKQELSVLAIAI